MKKSIVFLVMVGLLLFTTAIALADSPLVVWQFFGVGSATQTIKTAYTEADTFYAIIRAAEQTYGASVDVVPVNWGNYYTILNQALASHKAGDIDIMHVEYLMPYVKAGLVANISNLEKITGIYLDKIIQPDKLPRVTYNGNIYAVRWDKHGILWLINKQQWAKAGLLDQNGNPIIPTTPQEFINEAEKYKAATGQPFIEENDGGDMTGWLFYPWFIQNGAPFLSDNGWKAGFNTPAGLAVFSFMVKMQKEGLVNFLVPNAMTQATDFINGKTASTFDGTWNVNQYAHEMGTDLYVTIVPQLWHVSSTPVSWANGHSFVIPAYLPLQRQIEAYKFLVDMLKYNVYWGNTGHIPLVQLTPEQVNYLLNLNNGDRHYYYEFLQSGDILNQPFAGDPYSVIAPSLQAALAGTITPEVGLQQAADALNKFISAQQ
jgi:multiple sugar transport system substrate-binding protein